MDAPQGGQLSVLLKESLILHFAGNFPAKPRSSQAGMQDFWICSVRGFVSKRGKQRVGCSGWLGLCKPRMLQLNQGHPNSHQAQIQARIGFLIGILRKTPTQAHRISN